MENTEVKQATHNHPLTYHVLVTDKNTGKTIQEYDTEIAILFGVQKGDKKDSLPVQMAQIGSGLEIQELLGIINHAVGQYLHSIFSKEHKLVSKGKAID